MKMSAPGLHYCTVELLAGLALAAYVMLPSKAVGAAEPKFDVLRTGTAVYSNVTVTTQAKSYVFIVHDSGMASLKVAELPTEVQQQLGYSGGNGSSGSTNTAAAWAKREIAKLAVPEMNVLETRLQQKWQGRSPGAAALTGLISPGLVLSVIGVMLLLHLFYSYCCMLICRKAGNPGGILVWVPLFQLIPMLRAAGMSGWWFLAYFVPLLNLVPTILWPLRIAEARGKSIWVGVLLLLPITNFFAFLYLAFSNGEVARDDDGPEPKLMTLQTA